MKSITKKQLSGGFSFICYQDRYALCGQPQQEDLKEFKNSAWNSILNLRNSEELRALDFEMPRSCENLGLDYNHIPIIINGELNKPALQKIHNLLHSNPDKKTVIHCASGTRSIIALIAHCFF
ncbi:MAG: sulfur transferase domain-containing protein, partial [Oligoflexia bacterium]|nr:sulfur transferase domain-containing protein [Oligoflexia bacterium]